MSITNKYEGFTTVELLRLKREIYLSLVSNTNEGRENALLREVQEIRKELASRQLDINTY